MRSGIKHKTRKLNPMKRNHEHKTQMRELLEKAKGCFESFTDEKRVKGALSVIHRIQTCNRMHIKGKLKCCYHQHFCDTCNYIHIHNWAEQIESYRKSLTTSKYKGRLYFYVRDEIVEFPEHVHWNYVDTKLMAIFLKRKQRLNYTLFRGMAGFKGVIHRIEACYFDHVPAIRMRSLFITNKNRFYTESIDWQECTYYHDLHHATVRYVGKACSKTAIKYYLRRYLKSNVYMGLNMDPYNLAGFLYTFYNRATCTTGGDLFRLRY